MIVVVESARERETERMCCVILSRDDGDERARERERERD